MLCNYFSIVFSIQAALWIVSPKQSCSYDSLCAFTRSCIFLFHFGKLNWIVLRGNQLETMGRAFSSIKRVAAENLKTNGESVNFKVNQMPKLS